MTRGHLPGAALCAALAAVAAVAPPAPTVARAQASVVKCVDADGNVTYQDSPCTPGQAGRPVTLPKAETREDTSGWEAAARDARVVKGMPKRWVLKARGTPAEITPGTPRDDVSEIWRYAGKDGATLVGFAGPNVAWVRDGAAAPAPPRAAAAAPAAAAPAIVGAHNRRFVIAGRYCEHVFAEVGPADRQEPVAGADGAPGVRYTYEPKDGDPQMRTVFSCVGGKVADVERTVVQ
ncbi:MAG: DUF4124 domain-containing protein [Burkholderiales bacterium]